MKIHTSNLTARDLQLALKSAQDDHDVTPDVRFAVFGEAGTRQRRRAFEVQLGTSERDSLKPRGGKARRPRNSGGYGAYGNGEWEDPRYSATWYEWGYFISKIFAIDPDAIVGPYKGIDDFDAKTRYQF